ncbi:MAG: STAS domain-containing protein [Leptospirales bacterium]|nr:STAS domain-containing protein [Leptospirales bacterium]
MEKYSISTELHGAITVVSLVGNFDSEASFKLESELIALLKGGSRRILLDCKQLAYVSSSGIGAIMSAGQQVRDLRGDLKLCGLQPAIRRLLQYLGLDGIYDQYATLEEGIANFA